MMAERFGSAPVDNNPCIDDLIDKIKNQVIGQELKILDDFAKAFIASETIQGKDLIGVIKDYELEISTDYTSTSAIITRYRYVRRKDNKESK